MFPALMLLAAAVEAPAGVDAGQAEPVALFDELCLRAFPDDAALDRAAVARGAVRLDEAAARTALHDAPGRGWTLPVAADGRTATVLVQAPPFHTCTVRFPTTADDTAWRALADGYTAAHPGFVPQPPLDQDNGDLHVHAAEALRPLTTGGSESLMLVDQAIADPARPAAQGGTEVMRRLVHQLAGAPD